MKRILFFLAVVFSTQSVNSAPEDGKIFKDWVTRCVSDKNVQQCHIEQNIVAGKEEKQRLLTVQLGIYQNRKIASFIPPLGVLLQQGVRIEIDTFKFSKPVPYTFCNSAGCFASVELDEKMVGLLKKGNKLVATIISPNGKEIAVPVSLGGFTPAFESLETD